MRKNGFTLVELMVVIVIIGVLAAVAIPKMMAATNKAKASEAPQMLGAIANMQATMMTENDTYLSLPKSGRAGVVATGNWLDIGFDQIPGSRYFDFESTGAATLAGVLTAPTTAVTTFEAKATQVVALGNGAPAEGTATINQLDVRTASDGLNDLIPNWR